MNKVFDRTVSENIEEKEGKKSILTDDITTYMCTLMAQPGLQDSARQRKMAVT